MMPNEIPATCIEILEEAALAGAQSSIYNAMSEAKLTRAEVGRRMGSARSFVTRILQGDYNLTIRTYARALAACGFEARFSRVRIDPTWNELNPRIHVETNEGAANEKMRLAA